MVGEERQEHTVEDVEELVASSESQNSELEPYKSFEQKYLVDSGIKDFTGKFLEWGASTFEGAVVSLYRIPTAIRKNYNKQLLRDRFFLEKNQSVSKSLGRQVGSVVGSLLGGATDIILLAYTALCAEEGHYLPLYFLAGTNVISGAFELGRWSRSKQENLEMKAQTLEAEKL